MLHLLKRGEIFGVITRSPVPLPPGQKYHFRTSSFVEACDHGSNAAICRNLCYLSLRYIATYCFIIFGAILLYWLLLPLFTFILCKWILYTFMQRPCTTINHYKSHPHIRLSFDKRFGYLHTKLE